MLPLKLEKIIMDYIYELFLWEFDREGKNLKLRGKINIKLTIVAMAAFVVVVSVMIGYAWIQDRQLVGQTEYSMCNDTKATAKMIDYTIAYALNSLQVTSTAVANTMTDSTLIAPKLVLEQYIDKTPFSSMSYIRADGADMTRPGISTDASGRESYIKGMQGKTGIWVDYSLKYSDEPLINFYTPLYFGSEIVGVITGTIGGNGEIKNMLISELYNQQVKGMLIDENNMIVSSTEQFPPGMELNRDTMEVEENYKQAFVEAIERADGQPFNVGGTAGDSIGACCPVGSTGWKVIHIFPSVSIAKAKSNTTRATYLSIGLVFSACLVLFICIMVHNNRTSRITIRKANSERDELFAVTVSMAGIYYNMYLITLTDNSLVEYSASDKDGKIVGANKDAAGMLRSTMEAKVTDKFLQRALEFTDLSTLPERMRNRKIISADLLAKELGWIRVSFITIEADGEGVPYKVIGTIQVVDEEKRREEQLILQSNTDELTGFFNRRAYEEDLRKYMSEPIPENFVYISMDINGLKNANDNLGHDAGDELIKGAAKCMQFSFGNYGKIYRTGGDEFVAVIFADGALLNKIRHDFIVNTDSWTGSINDKLAVSAGYVMGSEFPDKTVIEIAKIADKRMYESKSAYYCNMGIDRRGQAAANTALCALYIKIVKVNLTDDTYQIISISDSERQEGLSHPAVFSEMMQEFARTGMVHWEDLPAFIAATDISYLRKYFAQGKKSLSIGYRRLIDGEWDMVMLEMITSVNFRDDNQEIYLYLRSLDGIAGVLKSNN